MPDKLTRFGISMEESLLEKFDSVISGMGYANRSEAIRDLIREAILQQNWSDEHEVVAGSILLFYDHHRNNLVEEMLIIQHDFLDNVLATTHFHVDQHNCLEIIAVRGKAGKLKELSDRLKALKGVFFGKLTVAPLSK